MDYKEKVQILLACSSKKGNRCSSCPAFGKGNRNCWRNAMRDAATDLSALQAENEKLRANLAAYEDTGMEPCDYSAVAHALEKADQAKSDLTEMVRLAGGIGLDRLREFVQADKEGRIRILSAGKGKSCGTCANFQPVPGHKCGDCKARKYFRESQSRKACSMYIGKDK